MSSWFNIYTPLLRHKAQLLHPSPRASNCSPPWFARTGLPRAAPCHTRGSTPSIPSPPTQPTLLQLCSFTGSNSLLFLMSDFPFPLIFSWKGRKAQIYPTSTSSSLLCGSLCFRMAHLRSPSGNSGPGSGRLSCGSRQVWFRVLLSGGSGHSHLLNRHLEQKLYDSPADTGKGTDYILSFGEQEPHQGFSW